MASTISSTGLKGEEICWPTTPKKIIYARMLANEYKYVTIGLSSLFVVSFMLSLVTQDVIAVLLLILIVVSLLAFIISFKKHITWSVGAEGEEKVSRELERLGHHFFVIDDLKLPNYGGNIDHIVLGKNGLFVIETKNHGGKIKCHGDHWEQETAGFFKLFSRPLESPSKQVKQNVIKLKEFLQTKIGFGERLWFDAVVVFANKNANIKEISSRTVGILKIDELNDYIKNRQNANLKQDELSLLAKSLNNAQSSSDGPEIFALLINDVKNQFVPSEYLRYVKFGLIFGLFWLAFDQIIWYAFTEAFTDNFLDAAYDVFSGGIVPFVLGKFFLGIAGIRIRSKIANLMIVSLIGWLPFALVIWSLVGFSMPISFVYILARVALVVPVMLFLDVLRIRI